MSLLQETRPLPARSPLSDWKANPIIYEINTWVWLRELSQRYGRAVTLADVPSGEIDALATWGFDAVWLMGVWHRGQATRSSALNYLHEYRQALPDITEADVPGSAYAISDYQVEEQLGGRRGLAIFRARLRQYGIKLILDFVPNHVATDHRWTYQYPEYFIQGAADDARRHPVDFFSAETADGEGAVIARGRDPYFPSWIDTAQLNAFHPGLRKAVIGTLIDIGSQCDGVRCDMAMLTTNAIFALTWNGRASNVPERDYWREVLPTVRAAHPQMMFIAEVYWDMEHKLQQQGFDYTYDKRMYDRLINGEVGEIRAHLAAHLSYLRSNIRFIENHDEPRAMATLGQDRQWPAATLIATLPGAVLLHQGQISGRRVKLPVQINRQAVEPTHTLLQRFYRRLLGERRERVYHDGDWQMLEPRLVLTADFTYQNLICYSWQLGESFRLVVVNLCSEWSRALVSLEGCSHLSGRRWRMYDVLHETYKEQNGDAILQDGLLLEVPPFGALIYRFEPAGPA